MAPSDFVMFINMVDRKMSLIVVLIWISLIICGVGDHLMTTEAIWASPSVN